MAHGHPDYAPVAGEALGGRGFLTYQINTFGPVGAGMMVPVAVGTVAAGYHIYQAVGIVSANGCDTIHAFKLFAGGVLWRYNYFEVEAAISYPRSYIAKEGEDIDLEFWNWDNVQRHFVYSAVGIILEVGTQPLNPQREPGAKPELKKGEELWLIDDTMYGKRWQKVKQQKITDLPEAVPYHIEDRKGA